MPKTLAIATGPTVITTLGAVTTYYPFGVTQIRGMSAIADAQSVFRSAGTITGIWIAFQANNRDGSDLSLWKNEGKGNGNVSVPAESGAGLWADASGSDSIAVDDTVALKYVSGVNGNLCQISGVGGLFEATTNTVALLVSCDEPSETFSTANTTRYWPLTGNIAFGATEGASDGVSQSYMPLAGTLQGLYVRASANSRTTDTVILLRKQGQDGNNTITLPGSSGAGTWTDVSHTDTVAAGDFWSNKIVTGIGSGSVALAVVKYELITTAGTSQLNCSVPGGFTILAGNNFYGLGGAATTNTAEGTAHGGTPWKLRALAAYVVVSANTRNADGHVVLRKGAAGALADTGLDVTITADTPGLFSKTDAPLDLDPEADALATWKTTRGGTSGAITVRETVLVYAAKQVIALGQVTEADAAQPITIPEGGAHEVAVGQVTEADAASAIPWAPKHRLVEVTSEADAASAIPWAPKHRLVDVAQEAALAAALASTKVAAVGPAAEGNMAVPVVSVPYRLIGVTLESAAAGGLAVMKLAAVGVSEEAALAYAILWAPKHRLVGPAGEGDTAPAVTVGGGGGGAAVPPIFARRRW